MYRMVSFPLILSDSLT